MKWDTIKMDLKQRFLNYETAKGFFFVFIGLVLSFTAIYKIQYVIQVTAIGFGLCFFVVEGIRKIAVNRIKQQIKQDQLKQEALQASDAPLESPKVAAPGATV